jgi:thiol:disulfide interchange protein DsbD
MEIVTQWGEFRACRRHDVVVPNSRCLPTARVWPGVVAWGTLAGLLLLAPAAWGQTGFSGADEIPKVLATFETRIEPASAYPGEHVRLLVTAKIARGWHIYSLVPQGEFAPPPTALTVQADGLTVLAPPYETNPVEKRDVVFDMNLAYHPDTARFYQNLQVPPDRPLGPAAVSGEIRYQVCNDRLCTPPRKETLRASLGVSPGPVRPAYANMLRTIDFVDSGGKFRLNADSLESALSGGLWGFLLLAAGFGALALLTPCVFPMIPVTVSFFTSAGAGGKRSLKLPLLFAGGIVGSTTVLGLLLTVLLGAGGVGRFAASPWVNLAVGAFFVAFAFSLLGLFDLSLPSGLVQRVNLASQKTKGPVGVLLMGVAFTATSFTCTMPFVGTLLVAATQGQVFWPILGMAVYSAVFSLPFFLLALFPQWVIRLRGTSGNWLVQVKVVLGLLELMAALKFVSNADVIWQWGLFTRSVVLALWALLALTTALVLLGVLRWPGVTVAGQSPRRLAFAALFLGLAVYLGLGATGRSLDGYTEAYVPPDLSTPSTARIGTGRADLLTLEAVAQLPWQSTLVAGLRKAQASGKPVLIDFTGYTCVNCRWMEKHVFAERTVYETLRDRFVLVQLYTDGGANGDENQRLQIDRFRTIALPYYVVLSADDALLGRHAGITPSPEAFLAFLAESTQPRSAPAKRS